MAPAPPPRVAYTAAGSNATSNSRLMKVMESEIQEYVEKYLSQDCLIVLPRPVGNSVAPHRYHCNVEKNVSPGKRGAFLFTGDLDAMLWQGEIEADTEYTNLNLVDELPRVSTAPPTILSLDQSISVGSKVIKCSTAAGGVQGCHYSNNDYSFKNGLKFYPGNWNLLSSAVRMGVKNTSKTAITPTFYLGHIDLDRKAVLDYSETGASIAAGATTMTLLNDTAPEFGTWADNIANTNISKGVWFGYTLSGDLTMYSGAQYLLTLADIAHLGPTQWTKYSLWNLIENGSVAKAQYESSARHCVTGQRCTFTNTTPELSKGGNIYGAKLPGNSYQDLPGDYDSLRALLSSQPTNYLRTHELATGCNYSFTPEKQSDWEFVPRTSEDPILGNAKNLPYYACCYDATSISETSTFVFDISTTVEYLSTDPSNLFFTSHANATFYFALLNELSMHTCVSENPDHFKMIKQIARKVCTSDNLKMAMSMMIGAGVKLAPLALSLLA